MVFSATHIPYPISPSTSPMSFACSTIFPRASPAFLAYGLLRSRLGIVQTSLAFALAAPSGDFKAFARELFMSDYDMGDGGHVFRTC